MIKVAIADDHPAVRAGLRQVLAGQGDICVAGEASNGNEALVLVHDTAPDILVLDLSMPEHSGMDALRTIRTSAPRLGILIFSAYPEEHYALILMRHGADGYLHKGCEPGAIPPAVRAVADGRRYITPALVRQLEVRADQQAHHRLSAREFQIFLRLARGETSGRIARQLALSIKSVGMHRTNVMAKLALHSNSDLTYYAVRHHLIG